MQKIRDASDQSAGVHHYLQAKRLLDDPYNVVIEYSGNPVATLYGLQRQIGRVLFTRSPASLYLDGLAAFAYSAIRLIWTHDSAMRLLQGMTVQSILGPSWLVLAGSPTLFGDPRPGFRKPTLVDVVDNPKSWSLEQIFTAVRLHVGLS